MSDITDELRAFEGGEALGNGDFSACFVAPQKSLAFAPAWRSWRGR